MATTDPAGPQVYQLKRILSTMEGIAVDELGDPSRIYQQLNLAGADYQGQLSYAYGESGGDATVEVTVNLASLIPYLDEAGVALEVGVEGNVSKLKQAVMILHRFPKNVAVPLADVAIYVKDIDEDDDEEQYLWATQKPLSLMALVGNSYQGGIKVTVKVGVEAPFPEFIDGLGIKLALSAEVSGKVSAGALHLTAPQPYFFPSPSDAQLEGRESIQQVVHRLLFTLTEQQLDNIAELVQNQVNALLGVQDVAPQQPNIFKRAFRFFTQAVRNKWNKWRTVWQNEARQQIREASVLKTKINALIVQIKADKEVMEGKDDLLDELSKYLELLDAFMATRDQGIIQEQGDGAFANLGSNLDLLTQFSMFTWGAVGTLTSEASAGLEIADLEAEAAAKFTSSYQVQRVSYRYQAINKGNAGETLVSTQDTYISYRNYGFSASAEAKVTYDDLGAIKEAELSDSYATMTYLSIIRFWKHPFAAHFAGNRMEIDLWERSGFSYGMSVPFHHLIDCANGKQPKLKTAIMEQLRVAEEDLNTFLSAAKKTVFGQVKADEEGFYNESDIPDQVFLESAFTFGPKKKMWAKFIGQREPRFNYFRPIDGIEANPALKKTGLIADSSVKLQSIRLRTRIQDVSEVAENFVKLGLNLKFIEIKINFDRIRKGNREGFFDLYVHWFNNEKYNTPAYGKEAQEDSVPPVVLLYQ